MEIPIYIEEARVKNETEFRARPLFIDTAVRRGELLSAVTTRLSQDLRELFHHAGDSPRHDDILEWTFFPETTTDTLDVSLLLRHTTVHCRLLVVAFSALGRRIAFSPTIPHFWFEVAPRETLRSRSIEALTAYFRALEKEHGAHFWTPPMASFVRGWVSTVNFHWSPAQKVEKPGGNLLAALMGEKKMDGNTELRKVARRIDALYPDELSRAVLREPEVAELTRLMEGSDRRPALLVGPPMSGKTTIVHEYVHRRRSALTQPSEYNGTLWLISPQRLISGMMYAGQWENRLLAILDHMKDTQQVLYLDDLPGFYHAGISAQSKLTAAQVLRPYIERRDIRVLAEITPESLRVLQERDRGFADLFHIIPVREPPEPEARRILLSVIRQLEAAHHCRFSIDVLPTAMELQARYVRELALPGKVAVALHDMAAKFHKADVTRHETLQEFKSKSGMSVGFLDRRATLDRAEVEKALRENVIGQEDAVTAMADVVSVAKAQLNDPTRPLGSFLFLGPTGVGKTQAAKALAKYLFSDADRLLRFDMNEFLDPYSAQRLVGTWLQPEGLLTSAVRRQPFSVILLDEIEKADPAVFDLLLQVFGEGRLTDSLGRTSDFANCIIIMTSNLGVREAESSFGFASAKNADRADAFRRAAQSFFRPEFFNRIDRIVPFSRLSREQTQQIASDLITAVLQREGLRQRKCTLSVMPAAMERIVDAGYQPELGARALKRAIERQLTQPVAAQLASIEPGTPTLIDVYPRGTGVSPVGGGTGVSPVDSIGVHVRALPYAPRLPQLDLSDHPAIIKKMDLALDRLHDAIQDLRPTGRLTVGAIAPIHARYFALKDQFEKIERLLERFEKGEERRTTRRPFLKTQQKTLLKKSRVNFRALLAAHDIRQYMTELAVDSETPTGGDEDFLDILREVALLQAMQQSTTSRVALVLRALSGPLIHATPVFQLYSRLEWKMQDLTPTLRPHSAEASGLSRTLALVLDHPAAAAVGLSERGIHLVMGTAQQLHPIQVLPIPLEETDDPLARILELNALQTTWQAALAQGSQLPEHDPHPPGQILRIFDRHILDLRSALITATGGTRPENQAMVLAALPLPPEMEAR